MTQDEKLNQLREGINQIIEWIQYRDSCVRYEIAVNNYKMLRQFVVLGNNDEPEPVRPTAPDLKPIPPFEEPIEPPGLPNPYVGSSDAALGIDTPTSNAITADTILGGEPYIGQLGYTNNARIAEGTDPQDPDEVAKGGPV